MCSSPICPQRGVPGLRPATGIRTVRGGVRDRDRRLPRRRSARRPAPLAAERPPPAVAGHGVRRPGGPAGRRRRPGRPRRALLPTRPALITTALLAVCFGLQNATVGRLAVRDLTTVLPLTLTGLAADSMLAGGHGRKPLRRLGSVLVMFAGAATGSAAAPHYHHRHARPRLRRRRMVAAGFAF